MTVAERSCPACATPLPAEAQFCMHCGRATPTDPGVPPRVAATGAIEVEKVTFALAGHYRIEKVIGEGGMATVYLAEDLKHHRKVAVKVMRQELAATLGADRFLREVSIAAQLTHAHILPMHDSGESAGVLYYVMPFVDGESLRDRLARDGALPVDEALRLGREVAEGLAYAHKRGFIHRDIKPANILLNEGHVLVADFGIARAVEDGGGESLTRTGLAMGTPQYMAPEQATGERDVGARADVYAAGAVLYEMLTGDAPFTGSNPRVILTRSLTETPPLPSALRGELSTTIDAVVMKALARDPRDRYESADGLARAIDELRRASNTSSASSATVERPPAPAATPKSASANSPSSRGRMLMIAGGVLLVAVGAFIALRRTPSALSTAAVGTGVRGNRVAVLPFPANEESVERLLADGLAEDIRSKLAAVPLLTVIGSASSDEYRNTTKPLPDIGRELSADWILTGRVRTTGDGNGRQLVVEPQLVDARTGKVVWEKASAAPEDSLPALPGTVATGIVDAIGVATTRDVRTEVAERPTSSAEAYRALMRGRQIAQNAGNDPAGIRSAIQEFEQAVALDTNFVEAWSRLAVANATLFADGNRDPAAAARAKQATDRAVALAPDRALVRRTRATYLGNVAKDRDGSAAEIDRALRVAPNDVLLLSSSAAQDLNRGDLGSALAKYERALTFDPRSPTILTSLVQVYIALGRPADAKATAATLLAVRPRALQQLQRVAVAHLADGDLNTARGILRDAVQRGVPAPRLAAYMAGFQELGWVLEEPQQQIVLRLTPAGFDNDRAWWAQTLANLYWQRGDSTRARAFADSALAPTRQQVANAPADRQLHGLLALMLAYTGHAVDARAEEQKSIVSGERNYNAGYDLMNAAKTELVLGDKDAAVARLAKARELGYFATSAYLRLDPSFASLKGHPAFDAMLKGK